MARTPGVPVVDLRVSPPWWHATNPEELGEVVNRLVTNMPVVRLEIYRDELIVAVSVRKCDELAVKGRRDGVRELYVQLYERANDILEDVHRRRVDEEQRQVEAWDE